MTLLKQSSVDRTHSQPQVCVLSGRTTTMPDRTPANVDADLQHAPAGKVARLRWMFALAAIIPVAGSSILLDPMPVKYYETASGKYWPVTWVGGVCGGLWGGLWFRVVIGTDSSA
jgi:hypothetical protein